MRCDVVSARKQIYSGEISMLIASGMAGELGITPRHAPLLTILKAGAVRVIDPEGVETAGSVNVLTSTVPTLPSYGSRTHSVFVQVKKIRG